MVPKIIRFYMWQNGMCITYLWRFKQIEDFFIANGWELVDNPTQADVIIIGACASFLPFFDKYAEKIKSVVPLGKKLVVYGCLPVINKEFCTNITPNVDLYIPPRYPWRVERLIENPKVCWSEIPVCSQFRKIDYRDYDPGKRYIIIQEGCNEGCIFCPHRLAIGREKSRSIEEILGQVRRDVDEKARILVLDGNNAGSWGLDLTPKQTYAELLKSVLDISGNCEIYAYDVAPRWICKYEKALKDPRITEMKIPIQTTSFRLLRLMGHPDSYIHQMAPILKALRKRNGCLTLRTEIIIGFPTETEEELLDTLKFVNEYFDRVSCFSFDLHPSTKIAKMKLPFIDDSVIEKRVELAMNFFKDKPHITAVFDSRGRICANVINRHKNSIDPSEFK